MKRINNNILKTLLIFSSVFICMVMLFTISSTLIYALQSKTVHDNLLKSKEILNNEGKYPRYHNSEFLKKDNFTDFVMILIAEYEHSDSDSSTVFENALLNNFHYELLHAESGESASVISYARYWHGYLVPLKLQHTYTDIRGIRITNYILMSLLFIIAVVLIWRNISATAGCMFAVSILLVGFPMVALCMQFSTCFYIMLLSVISILLWPRLSRSDISLCITLFVIGGVTSYLDFLTVPIITLGFPLAISCLKNHDKSNYYLLLKASFAWLTGYGGIWASKWIIATIFTDFNVIDDAFDNIETRTFDTIGLDKILDHLTPYLISLAMLILISMILCILFRKDRKTIKCYSCLVLIGCYPLIWYAVLQNHSLNHCWFTWRALCLTLFCWGLYCIECIDFKALFHWRIKKLNFRH